MSGLEITSTEFVFLLPIAVLIYYLIPRKIRQYYLLVINLLFYASFGYMYIPVIIAEALIAWTGARYIKKKTDNGDSGRSWLFISVAVLMATLVVFKLGGRISTSIVAPLGISFYTLQAVSYIADVKRGVIEPENNPVKLIIYLSFFPTITSGPIYRYKDFVAEHNRNITELVPEYDRIINGSIYMIYGYFLKLVIAARAGIAVDKVFADHADGGYGGLALAIVACLYSIQIYTDFAGYSAIVIGIAQMLGYSIPENFTAPYLSMSVKEFWGRWHISLSSWLKDYIYIPLGGNRKGKFRKYLNIMITFTISGIWHGVNGWHFLVWGMIHGIYQVAGDLTKGIRHKVLPYIGIIEGNLFHRMLKKAITFVLVTVAWIFFRTGVGDAIRYLKEICDLRIGGNAFVSMGMTALDWTVLILAMLFVILVDTFQYKKGMRFDEMLVAQGYFAKCTMIVIISLAILIFGIYGDQHDASYFIYRLF